MKKFLIIFFAFSSFLLAQFTSWEFYGTMTKPVAGADIWKNSDNLYVFGGYSDSLQRNVNWVQKLRIFDDVWELDSMNISRFGLVAENYNDKAYFYGGVSDQSNYILGIEQWGLNYTNNTVFSYNNVFNRIFSTGHIIGDNFYIIGGNALPGTSTDSLPYLVEYNMLDSNITFVVDSLYLTGDLPEQQMSEVIGDDIYIFGGVINGISQDIFKFNTINHSYEKLQKKLIKPRAGGRAVIGIDPNRIFIIGGYNEALESLNSVEIFTVVGDQYYIEEGPPIQDARYNFMSCSVDNLIYILGGFDGFDANRKVVKSIELLYSDASTTEIKDAFFSNRPNTFELFQNYPNPFNPITKIKFSIPNSELYSRTIVVIKVFDILGNEVKTLVNKEFSAGNYEVEFDASRYPSGIYYYQLTSNSFIQTKKMILLK